MRAPEEMDAVVDRARDGDERAFVELFRELQRPLARYVGGRFGVSVDDVTAETWTSAVRDLHRFRGSFNDFQRWLFTIARARAIDELRRVAKLTVADSNLIDLPPHPAAEHEAFEAIAAQDLLALVRTLPTDQADAVAARVLAGLDVATSARLLGKSAASVRINTHRGLRSLAALLPAHLTKTAAS